MKALGIPVSPVSSAKEALVDADLIVTVTPARKPIVEAAHVKPGATLIAVGSDGPDKQEISVDLLARAGKIVADKLSQCAKLGEIHHALAAAGITEKDVYGELGDIVIGRLPGREADELIVCASREWARRTRRSRRWFGGSSRQRDKFSPQRFHAPRAWRRRRKVSTPRRPPSGAELRSE